MAGLENTIKQFITSLLTSTPLVVTMQQLNKDYMNTIGEPIPYQKLGYNSLEHFLRSINDTVQVNGSGPTAQVIPYVSELSAHVHDLVIRQKVNTSKRGRGFQVKMFRQELNYQELGFNSLIDLCVCLASVFHYVRPTTEDFKLYDKSRPLPECAEKKFTVASYGTNKNVFYGKDPGGALPEIEWYDVNNFLPQDILKPGEEIPRTFVPSHIQENDIIEVVVGEIFDLSKFWVYLVDSPLDKLMDDIQDFYKEHASEYEIPQQLFKEGLYCVQVIFGEYHRGLIVDTMPDVDDMVRVRYVWTSRGAPWSKEATKAFRKLVGDRDTSAKIHYINREEQYIEVYLADSSDENNVFYINDKLVEEGFAQYTDKDRLRPLVSPIYTPIVKLIHLFPTFLELEHGLAPSTAEMEIFQECNVAINFCYPQYFYVDYSFEEEIIRAAEEFHETKVQPPPLDLTIFGELEAEISAFLRKSGDESRSANSDEDFVDADEESLGVVRSRANNDAFGLLTEQLKALNAKEEETVNVLRRDLRVTEDIMKDINLICKIQNWGLCVDEVKKELPEVCCDLENTATCNEGEFAELETQRELWTINETRESIDTQDSVACVESPTKSDGEIPFNHPLSKMSFDKDSETDEDHNSPTNLLRSPLYELQEPDVKLEPVDFSLAENTTEPDNVPSGDVFISKISDILLKAGLSMADSDYNSEGPSNSCHVKSEASFITSTNPFLNDTNDSRGDLTIDKCISNPNNPFLTFLDDAGSGSTSLAVEVKSVHAWSEFDDMSAETISELGRTLSSKSSSSSSVRVTEDGRSCSISTQTSGQHVGEAKTCNWSLGYTNPYYLRFGNPNNYQHGYQGLPFRGPLGFPPPPGFGMPMGPPVCPPVGPLMGPTRMPNYRNVPPRMADKFSGGRFPEQCPQPCYGSRSFPAPPKKPRRPLRQRPPFPRVSLEITGTSMTFTMSS
ncbi:hypothetical protein NQ318_000443 [Aromia moschata]|uniref:HTH OST-type domain-containing protein n=1 Tax=Aromia moschata TaxID=1265417 RepID=A0AAV8YSQ9_9CUCU|nr:hypothetical protein NQ318_000443 [Aromia moschata]